MNLLRLLLTSNPRKLVVGMVPYGSPKKNGHHDHRYNKGDDRTPAQKAGDLKREKTNG